MSARFTKTRYLIMTAMFAGGAALACSSKSNNNSTGPGGGGGDTDTTSGGGHATTINASGTAGGGTYYFSPTPDTVPVGTSVTWSFSNVTHTVDYEGAAGAPDTIGESSNTTQSRTFSTAGTYNYHCDIHTYMMGTLVVTSANAYGIPARKTKLIQLAMH